LASHLHCPAWLRQGLAVLRLPEPTQHSSEGRAMKRWLHWGHFWSWGKLCMWEVAEGLPWLLGMALQVTSHSNNTNKTSHSPGLQLVFCWVLMPLQVWWSFMNTTWSKTDETKENALLSWCKREGNRTTLLATIAGQERGSHAVGLAARRYLWEGGSAAWFAQLPRLSAF